MEEAALSLLRTVLRNTPAATSSSEYSYDSSPSLCLDMSPGEMKTKGIARNPGTDMYLLSFNSVGLLSRVGCFVCKI